MADFFPGYLNDLLTVGGFLIALITGLYQVKHYRAQSPNLRIIGVDKMTYKQKKGETGVQTRYELQLELENTGRKPTTISDTRLDIQRHLGELEMERFERESPFRDDNVVAPISKDFKIRVPEKDIIRLSYRSETESPEFFSEFVEGTVKIRSVGDDFCEHPVKFRPEDEEKARDLLSKSPDS
jgi:hypothetical protein